MIRVSPFIVMLLLGCSDARPTPDLFGLSQIPQVASVSVPLDPPEPQLTVVHLLDWHFIPRDLYAAELRARAGEVSEEEVERRYREFLGEVSAVKADQAAVLRRLCERGVGAAYQEGLTPEEVEAFRETASAVVAVDRESLVESVKRAEKLLDVPNAPAEAAELHAIATLALDQYDVDRLTVGAVGELLADGGLSDVRPLEDAKTLAVADPRRDDGTAAIDEAGQQRRDKAIVQRLLACPEPVAIVVLGGSHDLTEEFTASNRPVRYVRVETKAYASAGSD